MNSPTDLPTLLENFTGRSVREIRTQLQQEPVKVLAVAAGAWLAFHVLPKRWVASGVTTLAQSALLALGLSKALEFYNAASTPSPAPSKLIVPIP